MSKEKTYKQLLEELEIDSLAQTKDYQKEKFEKKIEKVQKIEEVHKQKTKQKNKKRKYQISRPSSLVIAFLILLLIYYYLPFSKVKEVEVVGNKSISTSEIKKIANINIGDNILTTTIYNRKSMLEKKDLIANAHFEKDIFARKVFIKIRELSSLFYFEKGNVKYVVDNKGNKQKVVNSIVDFPLFNDYENVKGEYIEDFIKELRNVKESVLNQISEISYSPSKTYKNRFLLKMTDKNYIYLLSSNISDKLNYYQELKRELPENKSVNIYLENANYFKEVSR